MKEMHGKKKLLLIPLCLLLLLAAACGKRAVENPLTAGDYDAEGNFVQLAWYPDAVMNDLNDTKWTREGDFLTYNGDGYRSSQGIDVSSNQDVIDWDAVKAAGVDFAIVRVGYRTYGSGVIKADELFYWNLKEAKRAGLRTGVYFFTQAVDRKEAEEEAQFVLDTVASFDLDLPIYYDTEAIGYDTARTDEISGGQLTDNAIAFCQYIEKAGYEPGIYGNQMWLCNKMDYPRLEGYKIWLAKYTDELNFPYEIEAWQYSSTGHVDGIPTAVDMNIMLEKEK